MEQASAWSRREVWTRKLLYPGHTFPTAIAPVVVGIGLAHHDGVLAAGPGAARLLRRLADPVRRRGHRQLHQPDPPARRPRASRAGAGGQTSGLLSLPFCAARFSSATAWPCAIGLVLTAIAGWPVIVIGLLSILASWAYSAGPWPFGRHGFADPLFFLFFGTVSVIGTYYVQAAVVLGPEHWREALPFAAVAVSLPIGALITNILIIDDIRDREFDVVKGKNTIAVRFGKGWSRAEFVCLLAFAYLTPFWLWLSLGFSAWVLLPLITLPLAAVVAHAVWTRDRFAELVPMTPRMAMLTVAFAVLPRGRYRGKWHDHATLH